MKEELLRALRLDKMTLAALEQRLRRGQPCVVARIKSDRVLLDMRTVAPGEGELLFQALQTVLSP